MTLYEFLWIRFQPFLPVLYSKVRESLILLTARQTIQTAQILDIGGRKSPYTIGLAASVTLLDLPRETEIQQELSLGLNDEIILELSKRRSNIKKIVLEDMTRCTLPSDSFDGVVCVEVLEHVLLGKNFLEQAARVLKSGGWICLTTPNGDYIKNEYPHYNPDHFHHYTRQELYELMGIFFEDVKIIYSVKTGKAHGLGLRSFNTRKPFRLIATMMANLINHHESYGVDDEIEGTAHLIGIARKR